METIHWCVAREEKKCFQDALFFEVPPSKDFLIICVLAIVSEIKIICHLKAFS